MTQLPPQRCAELAAALPAHEALPAFQVQALDAWGNTSGPADALPCVVAVECEALAPSQASFPLSASGRALIEGCRSRHPSTP